MRFQTGTDRVNGFIGYFSDGIGDVLHLGSEQVAYTDVGFRLALDKTKIDDSTDDAGIGAVPEDREVLPFFCKEDVFKVGFCH